MLDKENIKQVIKSQREWILNIDKGIKREKLGEVSLLESFALVISGIRRCGKSTLMSQILSKEKKFYYLNLEDPRLEGFELKDFEKVNELFEELYGKGGIYFFDEIQNVNKWELFIRFLADKKSKIVITGSNASLLSRELGTKLTGRHLSYELFPFSYEEFLGYLKLKPSPDTYGDYLYRGGFPEFLRENNLILLQELFKDILMRDVANKFNVRNISVLKKLSSYLISNVGKEFSYNSLKKMFDVNSVQTIVDYVSYLEDAYLIFTIPMFSYSFKKQQVNPKKVYSIDNGLSYVNSTSFSKDKGKMLENSVFLSLRRKYKEIFYFQENKECDFVVKEKEKITLAIQVCYEFKEGNKEREIQGLLEAMRKFKLEKGLILTYNQEDEFEVEKKKIFLKPVWKWENEENLKKSMFGSLKGKAKLFTKKEREEMWKDSNSFN